MPLYVSIHPEGGALLEDAPSDACVELKLSERASRALLALTVLESFEISAALGQLYLHGVKDGQRATRRKAVTTG
jgi:hypothetical protein